MKRDPKRVLVRRTWPLLFWEQCWKCKKEFLWEGGWLIIGWQPKIRVYTTAHVCSTCCPTERDAVAWFYEPPLPQKPSCDKDVLKESGKLKSSGLRKRWGLYWGV